MKVLTEWLRSYLPGLVASDAELAEALTLRGIAVEGVFDLRERFGEHAGALFETDITTNRVDAMNHYGIAREAAVIFGIALTPIDTTLPAAKPGEAFPVRIDPSAKHLCGRFTARVLRGVTIAPSTGGVAERFRLLEQKQISNAVDATNYVTQAIGQPTHAFDLDKVEGAIVVRLAKAGETLRTLDGVERTLHPEDLVVADERKALGIAGVMGGWDSMITPETKNVLVEAAWFDPRTVRRSSKRHGLHTDASHRFERGADWNAAPVASAMVSQLILAAGGHIEGPFVDVQEEALAARTIGRPAVPLRMSEVARILGPTDAPNGITAAEVETILRGLGCVVERDATTEPVAAAADSLNPARAHEAAEAPSSEGFRVTLPSWRLDLEREIDLLEEIARVYGYNRFQNTLPAFTGVSRERSDAAALRSIRSVLLGAGWSEAISSTFAAAADAAVFAAEDEASVPMENPLSEEAGMLRPSLAPGMLTMLAHNFHRGVESAALFEMGTVFGGSGDDGTDAVAERVSLAFGAIGAHGVAPVDFFTAKGAVEAVVSRFAVGPVTFAAEGLPVWLHPGRSARVSAGGAVLGFIGELHPDEAARRKLKVTVVLGELRADRLISAGLRQVALREISRFQPVRRDFSILLPEGIGYGAIVSAVEALRIAELQRMEPVEVLRDPEGKRLPKGTYSLLLRTLFQSGERTLREDEVQGWSAAILDAVAGLGGRLRGE